MTAELGRVLTEAQRCIRLIDRSGVVLPPRVRARYERDRDTIRAATADGLGAVPLIAWAIPLLLGAAWGVGQVAGGIGVAGGKIGEGMVEAADELRKAIRDAGKIARWLMLSAVGLGAFVLARRALRRRRR